MKYLLDTDTCISAIKQEESVLQQMLSRRRSDIALSVVTEAELRTGAAKSTSPKKSLARLENFLAPLQILEFTSEDAAAYARVRARLETEGRPIEPLDTLIAAHGVSRGLILVTSNEREFRRVQKLKVENWRTKT